MLSLLASLAFAEDTLLYQGAPGPALEQAEADTGRADLSPRTPTDLLAGDQPYLVGGRVLNPCTREGATNAELLRVVGEAEELRLQMRADESEERLLQGVAAWACLTEPADAALGARLFFLLGIHRAARGDTTGAQQSFRAALRSNPELAWDPDFSPDARPLFDAVRAEPTPETFTLVVVPEGAPVGLRVDGRTVALDRGVVQIAAGEHLIQLQDGRGVYAEILGDAWLVLPDHVTDALVQSVEGERGRSDLEGLALGVALDHVYVPQARGTWELDAGAWTLHRQPLWQRSARPMMVGGAALAVGGFTWMGLEARRARALREELGADTDSLTYEALSADYRLTHSRWLVATGLGVSGLAATGVGLTFELGGRR